MNKYIYSLLLITILLTSISPEEAAIDFPKKNNLRQTYNDCALFSTKAVVGIILKKEVTINEIRKSIKERMKNNYTLPWGIEKYLKKSGVRIRTIYYSGINETGKIKKLKEKLSKKHPVIILIGLGGYPHYITLLGYNSDSFFVYDSVLAADPENKLFTKDQNGSLPGNRNIKYSELVKLWEKGGMYGLYKNYGIECFK